MFSQISTLEEQERFLSTMGFSKLGHGSLVQMDKVEWCDDSPSAPVSRGYRNDMPEGLIVRRNARGYARWICSPLER